MANPLPRGTSKEVFTSTAAGPSAAAEMKGGAAAWQALGDAGAELEDIGIRALAPSMEAKGSEAVTRDPQGNLKVEMRTPLNKLDVAYNHGAVSSYVAQSEGDRRKTLSELAEQHLDDPVAFERAASGYLKSQVTAAPMELKADLQAEGRRDITQHSEYLVGQKRRRDTQKQLGDIKAGIDTTSNDVYALARQGGTATPDFAAAIGKLDNQINQLRNPVFALGPEEIASKRSEILSGAEAEAVLGKVEQVGKTSGVEAAQTLLDTAIWDRGLNLSPAERESYAGRGRRMLNQLEAGDRAAAVQLRQQVEYKLDDALAAAEGSGDWQKIVTPREIMSAYSDNVPHAMDIISNLNGRASVFSARQMVKNATQADFAAMEARMRPGEPKGPQGGFDAFYSDFLAGKEGGYAAHDGGGGKPMFVAGPNPEGMTAQGNIDLNARPVVKNADGKISTVRSITIEDDQGAVLIPTVVGDKVVSNADAIAHYKKTGENLGKFKTEAQANTYAESLHEQQAQAYGSPVNFGVNQGANPDLDVKNLTREEAKQVIKDRYWLASGADALPPALAAVVGDTAVNMGTGAAKELLAASGGDAQKLLSLREARYRDIAAKDPTKAKSLPGWLQRNADLGNYIQGVGYADQTRAHSALLQAWGERQQALAKDPAGYVSVARADIAAQLSSNDAGQVQTGVRNSLIAQRDLGVTAPKILGAGQSKAIVDSFANPADPEKPADNMIQIVGTLEQRYGNYFPQVMAELRKAGMPGEAIALAQVKDDPAVAWRMTKAVNAGREVLRKGVSAPEEIDKAVVIALAPYNRTLAGRNGSAQAAAQQSQAAQLYAYQLAGEGVKNPGQQAVQDILGKHYIFADTYRVPTGTDAGAISAGAEVLRRELPANAVMPETSLHDPRMTPETRQTMSSQILHGKGVWLTLPDDSGLYLAYPQEHGFVPGRRVDGKAIAFSWSQITGAASRSQAALRDAERRSK